MTRQVTLYEMDLNLKQQKDAIMTMQIATMVRAGMFCILLLCSWQAISADSTGKSKDPLKEAKAKIKELEGEISALKATVEKTMVEALKNAQEIDEGIEKVKKAESNLGGLSSLGKVEQMKIKADRYQLERESRVELVAKFKTLYANLLKCKSMKEQIAEKQKLLSLYKEVVKLKEKEEEDQPYNNVLDESTISYYTVEAPATLREISALPRVYGDPTHWETIYRANRRVIKDKNGIIPEGTQLVIPEIDTLKFQLSDDAKSGKSKPEPSKPAGAPDKRPPKPAANPGAGTQPPPGGPTQ